VKKYKKENYFGYAHIVKATTLQSQNIHSIKQHTNNDKSIIDYFLVLYFDGFMIFNLKQSLLHSPFNIQESHIGFFLFMISQMK
jgi:hypothetical protein